jgi:hypothetical protein
MNVTSPSVIAVTLPYEISLESPTSRNPRGPASVVNRPIWSMT